MSNILVQSPFEYLTDRSGRTLANGKIYVGEPNKDPQNFPVNVYFDVDGTILATQPIRTNSAGFPCDGSGNPKRIYTPDNYSLRISDQNGAQVVYSASAADGFYGVVAADLANETDQDLGTGMVGWIYSDGAGPVGSTLHDRLSRGWVDVKDFGAIGDGASNDQDAFDSAASTGRTVLLPSGVYLVPTGDFSSVRFYSFDGATTNNSTIAIVDPLANSLAVGIQASFACIPSALPFGWVHLNGGTLNRTVYPQLWSFAEDSGNIVDEVDKTANPTAFGRGNGSTTFSLPDMRGRNQGYADDSAAVDATFILGKSITVSAASASPGISVRSAISTPAIRAFATTVNQGTIDIQSLQAEVAALDTAIDFAIVYPNGGTALVPAKLAASTRYVETNPFPGHHLITQLELLVDGVWMAISMSTSVSTYYGGFSGDYDGDLVIVTTGLAYAYATAMALGGTVGGGVLWTAANITGSRVKVWKVKGATA